MRRATVAEHEACISPVVVWLVDRNVLERCAAYTAGFAGRPLQALPLPRDHELHPKGLNPAKAIAEIKKLVVERR